MSLDEGKPRYEMIRAPFKIFTIKKIGLAMQFQLLLKQLEQEILLHR